MITVLPTDVCTLAYTSRATGVVAFRTGKRRDLTIAPLDCLDCCSLLSCC
jgi:hypothetical protein